MTNDNPYDSPSVAAEPSYSRTFNGAGGVIEIRRVRVQPIELLRRGYALLGDQYWLFLGMTVVGILLGSLVPLGILVAPMMVGLYLSLIQRERGQAAEFATMFRGFDQFWDSVVAIVIMMAASLVVILPLIIVFFGAMAIFAVGVEGQGQDPGAAFFVILLGFYPMLFLAAMACYVPFLFAFQLIADRKLTGVDAVKLSARGAWMNLGGIVFYLIVVGVISIILMMMCYLPAFFFMPISIASLFVLYRDIYSEPVVEAQVS